MHDALFMCRFKCVSDLPRNSHRFVKEIAPCFMALGESGPSTVSMTR
jgi:hypothetical protein